MHLFDLPIQIERQDVILPHAVLALQKKRNEISASQCAIDTALLIFNTSLILVITKNNCKSPSLCCNDHYQLYPPPPSPPHKHTLPPHHTHTSTTPHTHFTTPHTHFHHTTHAANICLYSISSPSNTVEILRLFLCDGCALMKMCGCID